MVSSNYNQEEKDLPSRCMAIMCKANCSIPSFHHSHLLRWRLWGSSGKQVKDLYQTRSENYKDEKGNEGRADTWAILVTLGNLAGVDISPLGNVLVEFVVSVANISRKRLFLEYGKINDQTNTMSCRIGVHNCKQNRPRFSSCHSQSSHQGSQWSVSASIANSSEVVFLENGMVGIILDMSRLCFVVDLPS